MIEFVFTPKWFYGKDIVIDIVSIFVLSLISFFAIRFYRIDKRKRNYLHLAISFGMIAASFIFKILTNFTIYYPVFVTKRLGFLVYTYEALQPSNALYYGGFFIHRVLTLVGLYLLYSIYHSKQTLSTRLIIIYLLIVSTVFTQSAYYISHMSAFLLLGLITYQYTKNYLSAKHKPVLLLAGSFLIITISQIIFMFIQFNKVIYVAAEFIQLVGYMMLLVTFIWVLKHGKKE